MGSPLVGGKLNYLLKLQPLKGLKLHIRELCSRTSLQGAVTLSASPSSDLYYSSYMKVLQLCVEALAGKQGRLIHSHIITNGYSSDIHLNTKLVIFYSKVGDIVSARKVFGRMSDKNVVSWTALISGHTQHEFYEDALLFFLEMLRAGFRANQFTYGSLLRACTGLRWLDGGMQIQGCVQKSRFASNLFVQSALVDLHSKCGKMADACYLFGTMSENDVVSWNAMIGGYAVQGFEDDSFRMFRTMLREGGIPDSFTLGSVLKASSNIAGHIRVCQTHGFIVRLGFGSHSPLTGQLIDAYAKCQSIASASYLYKGMVRKDVISCTSLMTGYAQDSNYAMEALHLFKEIQQMNLGMDDIILCSMLNICAKIASLSTGRQIHALSLKYKASYDVAMGNSLVDMYAKSGAIEDAYCAFNAMEEKNVISWTTLITGLAKHGYGHEAIAACKKMEYEGLKPNDVTFLSLLFACSHSGLTEEGLECINDMIGKYEILPQSEHFSCMVDLFSRGGKLEEAYIMAQKMTPKPDASLWGAILGACSTHGDTCLGEVAASHLFNLEPQNSVHYVVLASIYAAAGAWDHARRTRSLMEERSLKKASGCSFVHPSHVAVLQPS